MKQTRLMLRRISLLFAAGGILLLACEFLAALNSDVGAIASISLPLWLKATVFMVCHFCLAYNIVVFMCELLYLSHPTFWVSVHECRFGLLPDLYLYLGFGRNESDLRYSFHEDLAFKVLEFFKVQ